MQTGKPLLWRQLQHTERFRFLPAGKVEHVVAEIPALQAGAAQDIWSVEGVFKSVKEYGRHYEDRQTEAGVRAVRPDCHGGP